jgi:hypothetical protein
MPRKPKYRAIQSVDPAISRVIFTRTRSDAEAMVFALAEVARDVSIRPIEEKLPPGAVGYRYKFAVEILKSRGGPTQ